MEQGKVLKLKRSLYGLKQSPRNFFMFLKENLEEIGFEAQTNVDPCLIISEKCIYLVYVDNTLFFAPKAEYIDPRQSRGYKNRIWNWRKKILWQVSLESILSKTRKTGQSS